MLWLNDTHKFYFSGFLGLIIMALYFIFIYINIKEKKYNFKFSIIILSLYLILVSWMTFQFKNGITYGMRYWYQPFLLCVIVDGFLYLKKKIKNNIQCSSQFHR